MLFSFWQQQNLLVAPGVSDMKGQWKKDDYFFHKLKVQVRNTFPVHRREGYMFSKEAYCLLAFTAVTLLAWVEEETEVLEAVSFTALAVLVVVDFTLPAVCWVLSTATAFVF